MPMELGQDKKVHILKYQTIKNKQTKNKTKKQQITMRQNKQEEKDATSLAALCEEHTQSRSWKSHVHV
jgi:hypothetical protein